MNMPEIIITSKDKAPISHHHGAHADFEYFRHEVTDRRQKYEVSSPREGNQTVVAFYTIPPGKSNYPYHYHTVNEEVFYIISGHGRLLTPDGARAIGPGDIIVCPAGERGAHKITNVSNDTNLVYLDVDTNMTPEIAHYPHSGKIGIRAAGGTRINFATDTEVEYYYREESKK